MSTPEPKLGVQNTNLVESQISGAAPEAMDLSDDGSDKPAQSESPAPSTGAASVQQLMTSPRRLLVDQESLAILGTNVSLSSAAAAASSAPGKTPSSATNGQASSGALGSASKPSSSVPGGTSFGSSFGTPAGAGASGASSSAPAMSLGGTPGSQRSSAGSSSAPGKTPSSTTNNAKFQLGDLPTFLLNLWDTKSGKEELEILVKFMRETATHFLKNDPQGEQTLGMVADLETLEQIQNLIITTDFLKRVLQEKAKSKQDVLVPKNQLARDFTEKYIWWRGYFVTTNPGHKLKVINANELVKENKFNDDEDEQIKLVLQASCDDELARALELSKRESSSAESKEAFEFTPTSSSSSSSSGAAGAGSKSAYVSPKLLDQKLGSLKLPKADTSPVAMDLEDDNAKSVQSEAAAAATGASAASNVQQMITRLRRLSLDPTKPAPGSNLLASAASSAPTAAPTSSATPSGAFVSAGKAGSSAPGGTTLGASSAGASSSAPGGSSSGTPRAGTGAGATSISGLQLSDFPMLLLKSWDTTEGQKEFNVLLKHMEKTVAYGVKKHPQHQLTINMVNDLSLFEQLEKQMNTKGLLKNIISNASSKQALPPSSTQVTHPMMEKYNWWRNHYATSRRDPNLKIVQQMDLSAELGDDEEQLKRALQASMGGEDAELKMALEASMQGTPERKGNFEFALLSASSSSGGAGAGSSSASSPTFSLDHYRKKREETAGINYKILELRSTLLGNDLPPSRRSVVYAEYQSLIQQFNKLAAQTVEISKQHPEIQPELTFSVTAGAGAGLGSGSSGQEGKSSGSAAGRGKKRSFGDGFGS